MKITPVSSFGNNTRGARNRAVALLAVCLSAAALSAQSSSSSSTSGSGASPSTSSPSSTSGTAGATGTTGSSATDRSTSGSYSSADTTSNTSGTELKRGDRRFITKAAESSIKEVALSQLAQERASNPQVKSFAQQMVSDHSQLNSDLMQLAARKGVTLDTSGHSGWLGGHRDSARSNTAGTAGTAGSTTSGGTMTGTDMANSSSSGATGVSGTSSSGVSSATGGDSEIANDRHYRSLAKKTGADFDKEYVDMMVDDHESDVKLFEKAAKDAKDPEVRSFASAHLPTLQAHLQHVQGLNKAVAE